jgi:hypothetical protein
MLSANKYRFLRMFRDFLARPEGGPSDLFLAQCRVQVGPAAFRELLEEGVVSVSPDGESCKWTDYGLAMLGEMDALQELWMGTPVIPIDDANKDQFVIRQGEPFRGKFFILQTLKRAGHSVRIQDGYCSHDLLAWLYAIPPQIAIEVLTSPKGVAQDKPFEPLYRDYIKERPNLSVRLSAAFHDRRIILDDREVFSVGESLKDVGAKGTTIVRLRDIRDHVQVFDRLWAAAKPL